MEDRLRVFLAELNAQLKEIVSLYSSIKGKVESLKTNITNEELTDSLGYKLHNLYSAYEDMFRLVARFFENQIEDMAGYHNLLRRMLLEIEGIRPNLLSEESFRVLDELKGFRRLFRHAYSYELEADRVIKLAEKSMELKETFSKDFGAFKAKLKSS